MTVIEPLLLFASFIQASLPYEALSSRSPHVVPDRDNDRIAQGGEQGVPAPVVPVVRSVLLVSALSVAV